MTLREWRYRRWEDVRDDSQRELDKWGWSMYPSEIRRVNRRIDKAERKLEKWA